VKKNSTKEFKYVYGPVSSWRLGCSLGLDLISEKKACNFNCIYCQIEDTRRYTGKRRIFVPTADIVNEVKKFKRAYAALFKQIDYITFSGMGEPTLASNLGSVIKSLKAAKIGKPVAVLTNSYWVDSKKISKELALADFVIVKLDAHMPALLNQINRPPKDVAFNAILNNLIDFREKYKKRLGLQIMFTEKNQDAAKQIAMLARKIKPDEIQLNTPLRPCSVKPLSKTEMEAIATHFDFDDTDVVSVYDAKCKKVIPVIESKTIKRRGKPA